METVYRLTSVSVHPEGVCLYRLLVYTHRESYQLTLVAKKSTWGLTPRLRIHRRQSKSNTQSVAIQRSLERASARTLVVPFTCTTVRNYPLVSNRFTIKRVHGQREMNLADPPLFRQQTTMLLSEWTRIDVPMDNLRERSAIYITTISLMLIWQLSSRLD